MRKAFILLVLATFVLPAPTAAQSGPALPDAQTVPVNQQGVTHALRWQHAFVPDLRTGASPIKPLLVRRQGAQSNGDNRHPVLLGALIGAGAGAVSAQGQRWNELYCQNGGDEDCLFHGAAGTWFGAGVGAGVGALIGFIVSR
jgi:hypothetical protein